MKIAVLGINYYPEVTGIGVYTTQMCEFLAAKKHSVSVFTGFPYYPFGEDFSHWYEMEHLSPLSLFFAKTINGVAVKRANFYKPKKPNIFKRILHETSFIFMLSWRLIFDSGGYDLIICVSPPFLLGLAAYLFSRAKRAPFIFHVQDLQPDAAVELGMIKRSAVTLFLYGIEKFIYKKAVMVLTISDGMRSKILNKGIDSAKLGIFPNWADLSQMQPVNRLNSFSDRWRLDDKFVALHAGNMGEKQDMRVILEAARRMQEDDSVCFLIVGRGSKRRFVEQYLKKYDLPNVWLLDVQPQHLTNEMFSATDVALITQSRLVSDIVMPSKVFGPAVAQKPFIIASRPDCEIAKMACEHNFGLVIPPEEPEKLVDALYKLKNDRDLAASLGRNARVFIARERDRGRILSDFEENILKKIGEKC